MALETDVYFTLFYARNYLQSANDSITEENALTFDEHEEVDNINALAYADDIILMPTKIIKAERMARTGMV